MYIFEPRINTLSCAYEAMDEMRWTFWADNKSVHFVERNSLRSVERFRRAAESVAALAD